MKYIKSLLSLLAVNIFVLTSMINVNAQEVNKLESGIYEVQNDVYHEQEIGMTMARTYVNPTMKIEKNKDKVYFTVKFSGTNYMENYRILIDGKDIGAEIIEENEEEKSITLKFETNTIEPKMQAHIYVDAMGRDVVFDIITKVDTLNLIEKIEEAKEETYEKNVNSEVANSNVDEPKNLGNNDRLIGIGAIVIIGLVVVLFTKLKK